MGNTLFTCSVVLDILYFIRFFLEIFDPPITLIPRTEGDLLVEVR